LGEICWNYYYSLWSYKNYSKLIFYCWTNPWYYLDFIRYLYLSIRGSSKAVFKNRQTRHQPTEPLIKILWFIFIY